MERVRKVAQCAWQGAHQITLDHKSGFHNVPLHSDSWTYFGFEWQKPYYVRTVLCFGWWSSPFIYHSLSDTVAQHIRSRGVPILTWLDDVWLTNRRDSLHDPPAAQAQAAHEFLCLVLTILYRCGYFMSLKTCTHGHRRTKSSSASSAIRTDGDSSYPRRNWNKPRPYVRRRSRVASSCSTT